ncbi:N-acylamino acid racemase, partial [candidate division MSBL1 archaeon SCGC-AAA259E17]
MRISEVEAFPINVPLRDFEDGGIAPYRTNHNELYDMDRVLVRVVTEKGVEGWGEVRSFLDPSVTVNIIERGVGPMVIGRSPYELEGFRRQLFTEYANADMFFAPIEIA